LSKNQRFPDLLNIVLFLFVFVFLTELSYGADMFGLLRDNQTSIDVGNRKKSDLQFGTLKSILIFDFRILVCEKKECLA